MKLVPVMLLLRVDDARAGARLRLRRGRLGTLLPAAVPGARAARPVPLLVLLLPLLLLLLLLGGAPPP